MKNYYQSRHLANWKHMSNNHDTSGPIDVGALKGKGRYKGFAKGFSKANGKKAEKVKANSKGHGKEKENGKEEAKERKAKEKAQDVSLVDPIHIGAESVPKSK